MVVVAVGAHPDDIEFGCFGTLAKLSVKHDVYFFIFTAGELVSPKKVRIKEAEESGSLIDAKVEVLEYSDGSIPINGEVIQRFREKIQRLKPEILFTLYPEDTHQDHRAVSQITISSSRYVPTILFYETPQTKRCFAPNYFVDITDYFKLKEEAIKCFRSQMSRPYLNVDDVRGLAQYRAYNVFYPNRLFEAFVLYRLIKK